MLMRKSLIEFIREFWDTWDTAPYKENWLVEFQSECFMYSVKHFLPYYIIKDWIDDKTYEGIKNEANAVCPVRDKMFQEKHVHNHDWNMPPRHMKSSIMNVAGPAWLCTNVPISVASVSHTANLSGDMNANRLKIFQSDKYKYFYADENPSLRMRKASATSIELLSGAEMYSTCQVSFTGFGADCFVAGTKVSTPFGYKDIQDLKRGDIVYSYNTETDSIELSVIEHTRKINKNETIRVSTSNGSNLESTIDHRYWVIGKGYIPAVGLSKGDKLLYNQNYAYSQECTISKTTRRYDKQVVYDIQVSKNHNFFANNILVHNCIIADDLISADNAAKDKQVLKNALTFFKGTLPTRLNTKNTGVIWHIQQRLAPGDISGTILGDKLMSQVYSHTEIQAISERDVTFIYPCTGKVKEIHKGDLLWEDRFGDYTEIRFSMGDSIFRTQYQQDARASDSSIVKEEYIHYIEPDEAEMFKATSSMHYASHDCPVKDSEVNDYHGFVEGYGRENQLIVTDGWEEHLGYVKEKELLKTLNNMDRSIGQIIEDKANGAALYQDLRMDVPGLIAFDPGTNSKAQRLGLASVYLQSGAVRFVKNEHTDYLISQLIKFPFVVHDDIVDAFSQLVLYHFTQRTAGVYTNCFTYQNIIATSEKLPTTNQCIFSASLAGNTIKIIQVRMEKEKFIVCAEWQVTGLEQFEEFYINTLKSAPVFIDASYENALYGIIGNPRIILRKFNDRDRDKSIQLLKVGFYKKKILVEKQCTQTINDISKLRIVQTMAQMQKGTQVIETVDEGFAGCVRAVITTQKGLSGTWY